MSDFIQTEKRGHVLIIRLNRPAARNAFNRQMAEDFEAIVDDYEADADLRVAVICAEGPTFSAGQDLIAAARGEFATGKRRGGFGVMSQPPEKPLIAAVEGQALAGGMELTLVCDLIVAGRGAVFGLAEAKRGLVAVGGGCFRLPRRVPRNIAMELILTAEPRPAEDMHRFGYVNRLVEPGEALAAALELAALIARNGPMAVKASKAIATRSLAEQWTDAEGWKNQMAIVAPLADSEERREGLKAFAEKRDPVWTGR